jgi:hypothetical protein
VSGVLITPIGRPIPSRRAGTPSTLATRMRELLSRFKLPTVAAEVVRRLTDAGHDAALSTLLEVFEAEADARAQRRREPPHVTLHREARQLRFERVRAPFRSIIRSVKK